MKKFIIALAATAFIMASCQSEKQENTVDTNAIVMHNIMNRKSVRSYTGDTIPVAVMDELLHAAMAAPSGRNLQPWSIIVLTDKSQYDTIFSDNFNLKMYKQSGAVVIFCADTTFTAPMRDDPNGPAVSQINHIWRDDMGAVTENFLLAVEAHGLGACWTACYPYAERMAPIRKALQIPDHVVPYSVVPVGKPNGSEQPKDKWKPEKVHYNRW